MLLENPPTLLTPRLILRRFAPEDLPAVFDIYSDREANRFLPWFPAETMADARRVLGGRDPAVFERASRDAPGYPAPVRVRLRRLAAGGQYPHRLHRCGYG